MFLSLRTPRVAILCLDGLIDLGDLDSGSRETIRSIATLDITVAVSYRKRQEATDWLLANPLGIAFDSLVCRPGAWRPLPIAEALEAIDAVPCDAITICSDPLEILEAHAARTGAILVTRHSGTSRPHDPPFLTGPDFVLSAGVNGANLFAEDGLLGGYVAEVVGARSVFPRLSSKKKLFANVLQFANAEASEAPVDVCGRYFKSSDPRFGYHPLSLRLINAKRYPERQASFAASVIQFWLTVREPGTVTFVNVPTRPGQEPGVIARALEVLERSGASVDSSVLECTIGYPKQKDAGSFEARRANVRGVFRATRALGGERIVLVDDIATSFSTLNEGRLALLQAGAAEVHLLALSFHPANLKGTAPAYPMCPDCGASTAIRFATRDGEPFFGCSSSESRPGAYHTAVPFREGYLRYLESPVQIESPDS